MKKSTRYRLIVKPLIAAASTLAVAVPATADDLDIYDSVLASQSKPNILFVLDYSGSMKDGVNNQAVTGTEQSKLEILQSAVDTLLVENAGKVNVGLGSLYQWRASGVKWPISDLEEDANRIDPNIPAGTKTVADVISTQLERFGGDSSTATVNALGVAAAYFRGDPVLHSDWSVSEPSNHKPDVWNPVNEQYEGGQRFAALPSTYAPADAYKEDGTTSSSNYGWCTDYEGGSQGCEGLTTFACTSYPEETNSWPAQPPYEGNPGYPAGSSTTPAREVCKYESLGQWTTPSYISPLTQECQANFIVLISDGQPTRLDHNNTLKTVLQAAGVPGGNPSQCEDLSTTIFNGVTPAVTEGNCGGELLNYLATTDINPDINNSNVKTYTVGFSLEGPGKEYLRMLADKGQGEFYEASKPEELTDALNNVIDSILAGSKNFAELSIDVNPDTFGHDNSTYFSLFSPSGQSSWEGNLKGYFLDETGLIDINGNPATFKDDDGLRFADTAQSFWSSVPDGNEVLIGGASESITELGDAPNGRNIFTIVGTNKYMLDRGERRLDGYFPTNPGAGVIDDAYDWLASAPMGDPLHSKPVSVNYGTQKVVYAMTNQGVLHAFDATTPTTPAADPVDLSGGTELFAYMPAELLKNLPELHSPLVGADHVYGLDGTITRWHDDLDNNGIVNGGEQILLVFGMRRGGNSYYALNVSNPTNPSLEWQINSTDNDFGKMAQTWSRASLVSVNRGGTKERVLMFGGGFDAAKVDDTTAPTAANGNAIFMVDINGKLVWTVDNTDHGDMDYSIPSDLTIIDSDNNGMVDRAYFGDLGGQVWRVDFDNVATGTDTTVTKFADVYNGDHQPIFYKPSVSMAREYGKRFLAISFGTGDRTQPMLDSSENALYMLRDTDYEAGPPDASFTTINAGNIYDATDNKIGSTDEAVANAAKAELAAERGWAVFLQTGEKSLSQVTTFEGKFLATTFQGGTALTDEGEPDPCSAHMVGRMYIMNTLDAQPVQLMSDGSTANGIDPNSRFVTLEEQMTIPGKVVVVHPGEGGNPNQVQLMNGRQAMGNFNKSVRTVFWHAK